MDICQFVQFIFWSIIILLSLKVVCDFDKRNVCLILFEHQILKVQRKSFHRSCNSVCGNVFLYARTLFLNIVEIVAFYRTVAHV